MRIAVVGTGISGMVAARLLSTEHDVHVFESGDHIGGHAYTVDVDTFGRAVNADVGFMVFNRRTYPHFCRMLDALAIPSQESDMSLSVRCEKSGLEYQGSSLRGCFAQRSNMIRLGFLRMLVDIVRFNQAAKRFCVDPVDGIRLRDFLSGLRLGERFLRNYLVPMSAAIWSANPERLLDFPAKFILGFFSNHGLLQLRNRPQWMTIPGGSRRYATALMQPLSRRIHLRSPVHSIERRENRIELCVGSRRPQQYDHVVMACHADQALKILDADETERSILSAFPYQSNTAVLHTDLSLMPRREHAWASWNCTVPKHSSGRVSVTYDLNRLQRLGLPGPLCLTLNPCQKIDSSLVLRQFEFQHPEFSLDSIKAQSRLSEINGVRGISFCGAYWGYGFHEDGIRSALAVSRQFGLTLDALSKSVESAEDLPMSQVDRQALEISSHA